MEKREKGGVWCHGKAFLTIVYQLLSMYTCVPLFIGIYNIYISKLCMCCQMDGVLSMEYVDFSDLVWRTVVHPTKLSGNFEYGQSTKVS